MAEYPIPVETLESYCVQPTDGAKDFFLHHVNYRIKDPKVTLRFYSEMLGMRLVYVLDVPDRRTSLYFMGYCDGQIPQEQGERQRYCFDMRSGLIEFMYHWGSEKEASVQYASGNSNPGKGFCHICIRSPNAQAACKRLIEKGVKFVKNLDEGMAHGYCYIRDPDGYWVEILDDTLSPAPGEKDEDEIIQAIQYK